MSQQVELPPPPVSDLVAAVWRVNEIRRALAQMAQLWTSRMSHPSKAAATISMSRSNSLEEIVPQTASAPSHNSQYPSLEQAFKESVASLSAPKSLSVKGLRSLQPDDSSRATSPSAAGEVEKAEREHKEGRHFSTEARGIGASALRHKGGHADSGSDVSTGNIAFDAPGNQALKEADDRQQAGASTTASRQAGRSETTDTHPNSAAEAESNGKAGPVASLLESSAEKPTESMDGSREDAYNHDQVYLPNCCKRRNRKHVTLLQENLKLCQVWCFGLVPDATLSISPRV